LRLEAYISVERGLREIGENCAVSHKPTLEARAHAPREWSRKNCLRSQFSDVQIVLRRHAEGIRHPIEEGEHRGDIDGLGDLVFGPTVVAQFLHIVTRGAIRRLGHFLNVLEQRPFGGR